jgi:cyclic pyranopterin phosphate synthase
MSFDHFDDRGRARMVDVGDKQPGDRRATAEATVHLGRELLARVLDRALAKGDVLETARLAGIAAVKRTPEIIPLAHPLALHHVALDLEPDPESGTVRIACRVRAVERTGVEMEALTGAAAAALTVYDMCKGEDRGITINGLRVVEKSGGRRGAWRRAEEES